MIKICEFDHLIACSDYFARSYLNVHFLWRKLCWKTVVRYVTLNPNDVNDDVIFLFTFYKHRRKHICTVILKPNIEVTSSTRYLYENFLSLDSSDRAHIYARIYDFSYVRMFCELRYARKNLRTQNLRTETGVRTFVHSTPGSEGQYASSCQMMCRSVKPLSRYISILDFSTWWQPQSWIFKILHF